MGVGGKGRDGVRDDGGKSDEGPNSSGYDPTVVEFKMAMS